MSTEIIRAGDTLTYSGRGVGRGSAVGKLKFFKKAVRSGSAGVRRSRGADEETALLRKAISEASGQLEELYLKTRREAGEEEAQIFEIHRMLLADDDFFSEAESLILDGFTASYAVNEAAERYSAVFASIDDEYLSARAADLRDVASRVSGILNGGGEPRSVPAEGNDKYIIAADDLTPSETVQLDRSKILGFVTFAGSPNSHTAILARALGIPALIGTGDIEPDCDGAEAVIDADKGLLYINPGSELRTRYIKLEKQDEAAGERLFLLCGERTVTRRGREIRLYANIGSPEEARLARENDAEGVGLLRSEFLYLKESDYPDENKLFTAYRDTLLAMEDREVVIRTLDIGADKKIGYFNLATEENPALGLRGVRLTLARRELFKTQLRAICRASVYGKASVMLPMIVSVDEIRESRRLLREVQSELRDRAVRFDQKMKLGIMIETPAAALMSDILSREADFFSVGTNDLTQYTLAADRQNSDVADICEREREPVLRLIAIAAKNAHAAGIWIGVCGELAADRTLTQRFLDMGVDELSVSPPYVLPLRAKIRECD